MIHLDELSLIHPSPGRSFACDNLKAIWPNYAAVPQIKVVIASVIADEQNGNNSVPRYPAGDSSCAS